MEFIHYLVQQKDWANNEYNKFTLDDGQEYENVTFSVNRNGSTFLIDNNTEKMLDKYYVYSVENPVVIKRNQYGSN